MMQTGDTAGSGRCLICGNPVEDRESHYRESHMTPVEQAKLWIRRRKEAQDLAGLLDGLADES